MTDKGEEILNIFVIGFHHKKGCQIEFSYPEVKILPEQWKSLLSLAMPDGAHNYDSDAVYFHLPSLTDPEKTVFGVSCFKQIPIEQVKKKTSDMTRGAVQKAVCVLSTVPLYGYLQIKMDLVTSAFFEGDFSDVSLLKDAFHHLNGCLPVSHSQHLHDGMSVRDLIQRFQHKTLLLFKLVLLERKIIFFHSPVKPMCCCLLSLISLFPGVIEKGLFQSASVRHVKPEKSNTETKNENVEAKEMAREGPQDPSERVKHAVPQLENSETLSPRDSLNNDVPGVESQPGDALNNCHDEDSGTKDVTEEDAEEKTGNAEEEAVGTKEKKLEEKKGEEAEEGVDIFFMDDYFTDLKNLEGSQMGLDKSEEKGSGEGPAINCDLDLSNLSLENYGLPLCIFSKGNLCLPYLSISYLDVLGSENVRGFIGGAANVLFKQKRQLADVIVELEGRKIETHCADLRRQLMLTTEDLRFGEQLIKGLELDSREKGDDWFRSQFTLYLLSLLRTSLLQDGSKEIDHFNCHFVNAWKKTENYKVWSKGDHAGIFDMNPGHPCAGNLSVADMKLRFSQVMSSSESGRRINQAVTTTGKAVGGAIIQAKGAFTHWWSSLTTSETKPGKSVENI